MRKKAKKKTYNQDSAIRSALRRSFSRSPIVREVLLEGRREVPKRNKKGDLAKKPSVQYQCQVCGAWVSSTKIAVDHIDPVIPLTGFPVTHSGKKDWNVFIDRLWCDKANLQRICDDCHNKKTKQERDLRKTMKEVADETK